MGHQGHKDHQGQRGHQDHRGHQAYQGHLDHKGYSVIITIAIFASFLLPDLLVMLQKPLHLELVVLVSIWSSSVVSFYTKPRVRVGGAAGFFTDGRRSGVVVEAIS